MRILFICLALCPIENAFAAPICPPRLSQIAGPLEISKYFFKTATIGPADRRTLREFAKESGESEDTIAKRYAGSGDILCGSSLAQAQLVVKNDVILVPGHFLYDKADCEKARDLKTCKFFLQENGKRVSYEIAKEEAEGFSCPDSSTMKVRNDWAILRLKKPVSASIKPYKLGIAPCASEEKPADVIFVGKSNDFKRDPSKPTIESPRHYGRCQILKGNCEGSYPVMESDCDMDHGASGGGLFSVDTEPKLLSINSSHYNGCPESAPDKSGPYRQKCWSAASVPIAGELRRQLDRLAQQEI